jgi:nucleoside-diphosphate-sugar epimerase
MRKIFAWVTDDYDKIPAERVVMNDRELPGTVLRLPMVYGPGDPLRRFYPVVKRIADRRRHIIFPETLAAWRSPRGYVENVAAAIALAATDDRAAGRIYNVCEEPSFSELEWARKIAAAMRWGGDFVVLPTERTPRHLLKPGNAAQHWTASSTRIRQELGYQEPVPIEEAIRRTIPWERDNPPAIGSQGQLDYAAEDAAVAEGNR